MANKCLTYGENQHWGCVFQMEGRGKKPPIVGVLAANCSCCKVTTCRSNCWLGYWFFEQMAIAISLLWTIGTQCDIPTPSHRTDQAKPEWPRLPMTVLCMKKTWKNPSSSLWDLLVRYLQGLTWWIFIISAKNASPEKASCSPNSWHMKPATSGHKPEINICL